jgi:hypothetical protein
MKYPLLEVKPALASRGGAASQTRYLSFGQLKAGVKKDGQLRLECRQTTSGSTARQIAKAIALIDLRGTASLARGPTASQRGNAISRRTARCNPGRGGPASDHRERTSSRLSPCLWYPGTACIRRCHSAAPCRRACTWLPSHPSYRQRLPSQAIVLSRKLDDYAVALTFLEI